MLPVAAAAVTALFAVVFYINVFNPTGFTAVRFDEYVSQYKIHFEHTLFICRPLLLLTFTPTLRFFTSNIQSTSFSHRSTLKAVEESSRHHHDTPTNTPSFSGFFSSHTHDDMSSTSEDKISSSFNPPGVLLVMEEENESDLDILNQTISNDGFSSSDALPTADGTASTIITTTTTTSSTSSHGEIVTEMKTAVDDSITTSGINSNTSSSFPSTTSFLEALETCSTLECLRDAHHQPRLQSSSASDGADTAASTAGFNFPHFIIIGFQKTATNALYKYLLSHPQILAPAAQEPDFFTYECQSRPSEYCPAGDVKKYISKTLPRAKFIQSRGNAATFEASTHIVRQGALLAPRLRSLMPWLKIIICVREPIARAASMLVHNFDVHQKGCLQRKHISHCLLKESQISGALDGPTSYTEALRPWLEEWPEDQLHIIQYEELQEEEGELEELQRLKDFIGIDATKPENTARSGVGGGILGLRLSIARRSSRDSIQDTEDDFDDDVDDGGWSINREHYEELINHVSPDVRGLLQLLEAHGKLKDRDAWLRRWQGVWDDTLALCDKTGKGSCSIVY